MKLGKMKKQAGKQFAIRLDTLSGMTLIELMILLAFVGIIVFIALPTIKSPKTTDVENFARMKLRYLYERERAYFLRNGFYNSFPELAKDENGGPFLDARYRSSTTYQERGVTFIGPASQTDKLRIVAKLPAGIGELSIDERGQITFTKSREQTKEKESPLEIPDIKLPETENLTPPKDAERT